MRRIAACLLMALIALLPLFGTAKTERFTVRELRGQTPERWQETYQTARGETVQVDCEVVLPQVDTFPVLKVTPMEKRGEAVEKAWTEGLIYWKSLGGYVCPHETRLQFVNRPGEFLCGKDAYCKYMLPYYRSDKYGWDTTLLFPDNMDFSAAYTENSSVTLGEAVNSYLALVDELFAGEDVSVRLSPTQASFYRSATYTYKTHKSITPTGEYSLQFEQMLRGIPVLGVISEAFSQGLSDWKAEAGLERGGGRGNIRLAALGEDFAARMRFYKESAVVSGDVPIVSFDMAKAVWEKEIKAGRLREVRRVELGYYAYRDEKKSDVIWLLPVWTCFGRYASRADEPLTTPSGELDTADAYMSDTRMLVVSGQYGTPLDMKSKAKSRSIHPKVIIRKKQ